MLVGAFDSGFLDRNQFTICELYVAIRGHVKDNYGVEMPKIEEKYGEKLAKDMSIK